MDNNFNFTLWKQHFEQYEDRVNHFYLDGEGIVTVGIGCCVFDAKTIHLRHKDDGIVATPDELTKEFLMVKGLPSGKPASYYAMVCQLYMAEEEIDFLFTERLEETLSGLNHYVDKLNTYPDSARLALVDMAFNLGIAGLYNKFPKFIAAFRAMDWNVCARECERNGIQPERNAWTRQTFEALLMKEVV